MERNDNSVVVFMYLVTCSVSILAIHELSGIVFPFR